MSTRHRRRHVVLSLLVAGGLLAAGCGDDDAGSTSQTQVSVAADTAGGTETTAGAEPPDSAAPEPAADAAPLVLAVSTEPSTLDVQAVNDRSSRLFTDNIFESLLARDAESQIVPALAESYEPVNDTTWRFTLREGVTFHNGEPFDAAAAAFSINRMLDPDYETQRSSYINDIVGASAVDGRTLEITTDGIDAVLPIQMTQLAMVPPVAAAETDFGENPVGTGPYKFVGWDRGREITAVRNDDYWGEAPAIAELKIRIIPDSQTALAALQTGEVDLVLDILPEQRELVPQVKSVPATEYSYIAFNTYKPELADPRVRIAMNMAIDKELLAETIYGGEATPQLGQMLSDGMLGFNPALEAFPYNPEGAKALLAEAGYPDGFTVNLHAPVGRYLKGEETVELVADQLADVGITAEIQLTEWNQYREDGRIPGTEAGAFDLKYGWNSNEWFDASRIESHITCEGTSSKYCDPEVDTLMNDAAATLDEQARRQMYQDVWAKLDASPHAIYLLQQNLIYGLSERLQWEPRLDDTYYVATMVLTA